MGVVEWRPGPRNDYKEPPGAIDLAHMPFRQREEARRCRLAERAKLKLGQFPLEDSLRGLQIALVEANQAHHSTSRAGFRTSSVGFAQQCLGDHLGLAVFAAHALSEALCLPSETQRAVVD